VIDSHFHIWRRADAKQSGILAAPYLQRDASWEDFRAASGDLALEGAVNIQVNDFCDGTVEARYIGVVAHGDPLLGAMIAWARIESAEARGELERLLGLAHVRGVRRTCQFEADPEFCASSDYVRGVRLLGELDLLCEICVRLEQVKALPRLARACPETLIVLQHLGKPDHSQPPPAYWLRAIEELAALPNVLAKVSVVVHSDRDAALTTDLVAPFVRHVAGCFGPVRVFFGSNWPVAGAVVSYQGWVEMLRELLGDDERFWAGNARRLYRLPPVTAVSRPIPLADL
jgi:L-fuconolactonase